MCHGKVLGAASVTGLTCRVGSQEDLRRTGSGSSANRARDRQFPASLLMDAVSAVSSYLTWPFFARASRSAEAAFAALMRSPPRAPRLCHAAVLIAPSTRPSQDVKAALERLNPLVLVAGHRCCFPFRPRSNAGSDEPVEGGVGRTENPRYGSTAADPDELRRFLLPHPTPTVG